MFIATRHRPRALCAMFVVRSNSLIHAILFCVLLQQVRRCAELGQWGVSRGVGAPLVLLHGSVCVTLRCTAVQTANSGMYDSGIRISSCKMSTIIFGRASEHVRDVAWCAKSPRCCTRWNNRRVINFCPLFLGGARSGEAAHKCQCRISE